MLFKLNYYKILLIFTHLLLSLNQGNNSYFLLTSAVYSGRGILQYLFCLPPNPSPCVSLPCFVEQLSLEGLSASCSKQDQLWDHSFLPYIVIKNPLVIAFLKLCCE